MPTSIDLLRQEKGFFLPVSDYSVLVSVLTKHGFKRKHFPNPYTQTVYLVDDDQTYTIGVSFKARRYSTGLSNFISLDNIVNEEFCFEIKRDLGHTGQSRHEKTARQNAQLKKVVDMANESLGQSAKLRPYFITEYHREHWVKGENSRVTIDSETKFWFFPRESSSAVLLNAPDEDSILRIETKFDPVSDIETSTDLIKCLYSIGALNIIGKKLRALTLIDVWHAKHFGVKHLEKELVDVEIEAKFSVIGNPNQIFASLVRENLSPFIISPHYPFTITAGSVNHYWGKVSSNHTHLVEGAKAMFIGSAFKVVLKNGFDVIDPSLGIVEREERKFRWSAYQNQGLQELIHEYEVDLGPLEYVGSLFRARKASWFISPDGRIYHLSIDSCHATDREGLIQVEVEYSGNVGAHLPHNQAREIIVADLKALSETTLSILRSQSPVALGISKFDWLCGKTSGSMD